MSYDSRYMSTLAPETAPLRDVYSISRLNLEARELLEGAFPLIWVEGEISNLARPSSGHLYFALKDAAAQVRCALFRNRMRLPFTPENGMQVLARVSVSLYEQRGEFQLIVEHLEPAGDGALLRAFEQLKQRLAAAGLFDAAHKKPLPALPQRIGVVTSPTGAALRDILTTLRRRFPALPVLIYPVPVQGTGAAEKIAAAIRLADQRRECDVLIVARGGGSLEDLWAFNEEVVARAIYACGIPVVTGIGHEIDFTIADLVADQRAPTPTAAAELVSPDAAAWRQTLARMQARLTFLMRTQLDQTRQSLRFLQRRLQHPGQRLRERAQRLDELEQRLQRAWRATQHVRLSRAAELHARLQQQTPLYRLQQLRARRETLALRLEGALRQRLEKYRTGLASLTRALEAVSPLATLARGYAIVQRLPQGDVIRSAREVAPGDRVEARLGAGRLICSVEQAVHE